MICNVKSRSLFAVVFVFALLATGCNFNFSAGGADKISESEAEKIAIKTLQSFNRSLQKGDFEEFHQTEVADSAKSELTAEKFNTAFADFIKKRADIRPKEGADIKWLEKPEIDGQFLNLHGTYPAAVGGTLEFKLQYVKEAGDWGLKFINVKTS